jgi:hypothetical protein
MERKKMRENVARDNINKNIIHNYYSTATTSTTPRIACGTLK